MSVWFVIVRSSGFGILRYANSLGLPSMYLLLCTLRGAEIERTSILNYKKKSITYLTAENLQSVFQYAGVTYLKEKKNEVKH